MKSDWANVNGPKGDGLREQFGKNGKLSRILQHCLEIQVILMYHRVGLKLLIDVYMSANDLDTSPPRPTPRNVCRVKAIVFFILFPICANSLPCSKLREKHDWFWPWPH